MNRYTIYCTQKQTERAKKLGAPIDQVTESLGKPFHDRIPTAEQMCYWTEDSFCLYIVTYIERRRVKDSNGNWTDLFRWTFRVRNKSKINHLFGHPEYVAGLDENDNPYWYDEREDAVLAAIDAALDYLEQTK